MSLARFKMSFIDSVARKAGRLFPGQSMYRNSFVENSIWHKLAKAIFAACSGEEFP